MSGNVVYMLENLENLDDQVANSLCKCNFVNMQMIIKGQNYYCWRNFSGPIVILKFSKEIHKMSHSE